MMKKTGQRVQISFRVWNTQRQQKCLMFLTTPRNRRKTYNNGYALWDHLLYRAVVYKSNRNVSWIIPRSDQLHPLSVKKRAWLILNHNNSAIKNRTLDLALQDSAIKSRALKITLKKRVLGVGCLESGACLPTKKMSLDKALDNYNHY